MLRSMMQVYVKGSAEAVQLYQKAFDAKLISEHKNGDGSYMHAELDVFGQILALSESKDEKTSFLLNEYYEKLAQSLSENNMYAEQSSGIFRRCPNTAELGMNKNMLKCMKKYNVNIITASDAHCPEDVGSYITELNSIIEQA